MRIDLELKAQLARELCLILDGVPLMQVVSMMTIYPARISELRHGNLARFSIGRLVRLIASRGYDIEISIRPLKVPMRVVQRPTVSVVRYDRFNRPLPD